MPHAASTCDNCTHRAVEHGDEICSACGCSEFIDAGSQRALLRHVAADLGWFRMARERLDEFRRHDGFYITVIFTEFDSILGVSTPDRYAAGGHGHKLAMHSLLGWDDGDTAARRDRVAVSA